VAVERQDLERMVVSAPRADGLGDRTRCVASAMRDRR